MMVTKIIWKVILMIAGVSGTIFSGYNLYEQYGIYRDCSSGLYSFALGSYIGDAKEEMIKWGIILILSVVALIIGCRISTEEKQYIRP